MTKFYEYFLGNICNIEYKAF